MSAPDPYKIQLAEALKMAERHHTMGSIAVEVGCSYQSLSKLKTRYVFGPENAANLEQWLREKGYWGHKANHAAASGREVQAQQNTITEALALELEAKAAMLRSDLPEVDKKRLFGSWLRAYNEVWNQLNK